MKKLLFLIFLLIFLQDLTAQKNYWQQQTNYNIAVSLNDVDNTLSGLEKIEYINNSPDSLSFIWIHLWPNAYKNDRTAFSDQLLDVGRTDFYFSEENKKGYINQLSFKVDGTNVTTEDHPEHQDIVKVLLNTALLPGAKILIETPFKIKLPYNFSRGGHIGQSYQITQWYPKPAVYDKGGWHPMPYLDQGEFYSEFGNFDVSITLPENYVVAATGVLQNEDEKKWLQKRITKNKTSGTEIFQQKKTFKKVSDREEIMSSSSLKTVQFIQNNVHDFAWFADKSFLIKVDTLKLNSGKIIDVATYYLPENAGLWSNSILHTKNAVLAKSALVGEYPYSTVSVVDNVGTVGGGMEYPTITLVTAGGSDEALNSVIHHEVGHNWFYGILGSNERRYPWMDEGMNTYYDNRYATQTITTPKSTFLQKRLPVNFSNVVLQSVIHFKKDQSISTSSENFSVNNYGMIAYEKASEWMKKLENELGTEVFDKVMNAYYEKWKFKHPQPEDFKVVAEEVSGKNLTEIFGLLDKKGPLDKPLKKKLKLTSFFNFKETDKYNYVSLSPLVGYNLYDKLMIGALVHNYGLPPTKFQFVVAPLYAIGTSKLNGLTNFGYHWFVGDKGNKATLSLAAASFTGGSFKPEGGKENPLSFSKMVPCFRYDMVSKKPTSTFRKHIQFKSFLINESTIRFERDTVNQIDLFTFPKQKRYVNQLELGVENPRALYPYNAALQADQGDGFIRLNFTGNYYFNYQKEGGLNVRFFAGKFIYTVDKTFTTQFQTDIYHLNLSGPKGFEDYNYQNYFVGRNEFEGLSNQQIMNRDGFFKVRTDLLSNKIGKTDDWLIAVNLTSSIPNNINPLQVLPFKIPLKLFLDIGTFSEAWQKDAPTGRFLYDAGLQLSLFKNVVNIYVPVLYSKVYSDYFKSTITEKRFIKNISFNIDIQQLKLSKLFSSAGY